MNEREIFDRAQEIADEPARADFLAAACGDDPALRAHVEGLLRMKPALGSFLQDSPLAVAVQHGVTTDEPIVERLGTQVGPYKLLEQIGEGGMGLVYMAEQQRPIRRLVALKIIKPGMDSRQIIARFEAERQALALMDHPNIARVIDAGTTESGRPYFAMELVRGLPITEFCDQKRLPVRERLKLFVQVCQAVQHAHQKGILHRDLKPTNVLVTMHDTQPVPKIIDFGIAKALGGSLTEHTLHTGFAQLIGTPLYMSPEQAEMNALGVDTRSDVYSLGVLLYELLTGTTPFAKERLKEATFDELRRLIREEEPETISQRLAKTRSKPKKNLQTTALHPSSFRFHPFPELDWIVAKSLEKDRNRRYESASSLGHDIERYLRDEPVQACPPSAVYRFRKFTGKHRASFTTALVVAVSLLVGIGVSIWQAVRATAAEAQASANEEKARSEGQKAIAAAKAESIQRQRAEQGERLAKEQLEEAERQRVQANKNFEAALAAVDRMVVNVIDQELKDVPRVGPLRRRLPKDAVEFYERVPTGANLPAETRLQIARTWHEIGRISRNLFEYEQSRLAYAKAAQVLEQLATEQPGEVKYQTTLAEYLLAVGSLHDGQLRDRTGAEIFYRRATDIYAAAVRSHPNDRSLLGKYAHTLCRFGRFADDPEEQRNRYNRAADVLERANPTEFERAAVLRSLAGWEHYHGDPARSDALYRRALAAEREAVQSGEADRFQKWYSKIDYPHDLWQAAARGGFWQRSPQEAEAWLDESIEIYRGIVSGAADSSGRGLVRSLRTQVDLLRRRAAERRGEDANRVDDLARKADVLAGEAITRQRGMVARYEIVEGRAELMKMLSGEARYILGQITKKPADAAHSEDGADIGRDRKLQADALLTEAIQLCRGLAAEFPGNVDYKNRLEGLLKLHAQHIGSRATETKP